MEKDKKLNERKIIVKLTKLDENTILKGHKNELRLEINRQKRINWSRKQTSINEEKN